MSAARIAGWTYDIAREQAPNERWLHLLCERSLSAGYNFLGLYLEHRFAYPSAPWAWWTGALRPEVVRGLQDTYRSAGLRIVPFLNTLGHMEGFIRARGGEFLREGPAPFDKDYAAAVQEARARLNPEETEIEIAHHGAESPAMGG